MPGHLQTSSDLLLIIIPHSRHSLIHLVGKVNNFPKVEHLPNGEGWGNPAWPDIWRLSHHPCRPHSPSKSARLTGQCFLMLSNDVLSACHMAAIGLASETQVNRTSPKRWHIAEGMSHMDIWECSNRMLQAKRTITQILWEWERLAWFKNSKQAQGSERINGRGQQETSWEAPDHAVSWRPQ